MEKSIKTNVHNVFSYEIKSIQSETYISGLLLALYICVNIIPVAMTVLSGLYSPVTQLSLIFFLTGAFLFIFSMSKNAGRTQLMLSPLFLLYLIPSRPLMELSSVGNLETVNMLYNSWISGLYFSILYIPVIIISIYQVRKKIYLSPKFRKTMTTLAGILILLSYILAI